MLWWPCANGLTAWGAKETMWLGAPLDLPWQNWSKPLQGRWGHRTKGLCRNHTYPGLVHALTGQVKNNGKRYVQQGQAAAPRMLFNGEATRRTLLTGIAQARWVQPQVTMTERVTSACLQQQCRDPSFHYTDRQRRCLEMKRRTGTNESLASHTPPARIFPGYFFSALVTNVVTASSD